MGQTRRTSELRQAELIDAVIHIIASRGIAALNTRSLADEVGLTSGAIFRHFASLDALLDATVGRVETVLNATYPPAGLPARTRLERFVEARTAAVADQLGILPLVVSEQFRLALPPRAAERLMACVNTSRAFIERCLREGQASGEFRDDLDADALAVIVMGTMQVLARRAAGTGPRDSRGRAVRDGLFVLLQPPTAKRSKTHRRSS